MNDPLSAISTRETPQSQPIPGRTDQVQNSAGGYAWVVDDWTRLRRFLILGTEGGTFYISEPQLTKENASALLRCIAEDGTRVVAEVVKVSEENLAAKQNPTLFALAACAGAADARTRQAALAALPRVCRTGTHLFIFARYVEQFRGWGRGLRNAIARWYTEKDPKQLALQVVKYRQREGWSHRDLLRLAKPRPRPRGGDIDSILKYVVDRDEVAPDFHGVPVPELIVASERVLGLGDKPKAVVDIVRETGLPWEALPSEVLKNPEIWEAQLPTMGLTALIRNLGRLTDIGLIKPLSATTTEVVRRLTDQDALTKSRVHPFTVLLALTTYAAGRGVKGSLTWQPVREVIDALDRAFYLAFGNVVPSGKRTMLAIDISGSMTWESSRIMNTHIYAREAAAAMALITVATESSTLVTVFSSGNYDARGGWSTGIQSVPLSPRERLDDVVKTVNGYRAGGTDCALPMLHAAEQRLDVETFVVYTDNETWAGRIHPHQALVQYRQKIGHDAKLVVVGMASNGFSIADPSDPGELDVIGFDASAPQLISDFAAGRV